MTTLCHPGPPACWWTLKRDWAVKECTLSLGMGNPPTSQGVQTPYEAVAAADKALQLDASSLMITQPTQHHQEGPS